MRSSEDSVSSTGSSLDSRFISVLRGVEQWPRRATGAIERGEEHSPDPNVAAVVDECALAAASLYAEHAAREFFGTATSEPEIGNRGTGSPCRAAIHFLYGPGRSVKRRLLPGVTEYEYFRVLRFHSK